MKVIVGILLVVIIIIVFAATTEHMGEKHRRNGRYAPTYNPYFTSCVGRPLHLNTPDHVIKS